MSPIAMANTAGNAVSLAGDVPVASFSNAWRLSSQMLGSVARTSVIWLNHLLRIFAPVYRMPLKAFRPVSMRPFDNLKQRAWAHFVRQGKIKSPPPSSAVGASSAAAAKVVSPSAAHVGGGQERRYERIGAFRAMRTVYAAEGFLSLLHHLSPALLANVLLGTVMFTSYEAVIEAEHLLIRLYPHSVLARVFTPRHAHQSSVSSASIVMPPVSYPGILLAGAFSGLSQSFVITPIQSVNTHYEHSHYLHTLSSSNPHDPAFSYSAAFRPSHHSSLRHIFREEGVRGVFRGLTLTCVRDTLGMATFFGTFQLIKTVLVREEHFGEKHRRTFGQWLRDRRDAVLGSSSRQPQSSGGEGGEDEAFLKRELGWSRTHVWNSVSIVVAGVCAGFSYRLLTHPFVVLQHRRDRDYLIKLNDTHKFSAARVPLLAFASQATGQHFTHPPAWRELLEQYRKEGLKFLKLDPSSSMSAFGFPKSLPSLFNRLTLIFTPSVVGLLSYELSKMHQESDVHQH